MEYKNTIPAISVIGAGRVGLTLAVCYATRGFSVKIFTPDPFEQQSIDSHRTPFFEPGLETLLDRMIEEGHLIRSSSILEAVRECEVSLITVSTPRGERTSADLINVQDCAKNIGQALREKESYHLVVVKSTVLPGTTRKVVGELVSDFSGKSLGSGFGLCHSPEFLREGSALSDIYYPDRLVIGEFDMASGNMFESICRIVCMNKSPILRMTLESAELSKYACNAFLATKVSFINEISRIAEEIPGVDILDMQKTMGLDCRISPSYLNPGVGFGGPCLGKDIDALIDFARRSSIVTDLLKAVVRINLNQPEWIVRIAERAVGPLTGLKVSMLGLSYKPNTDDMRDASSIEIIKSLCSRGVQEIRVYDPRAISTAKRVFDTMEEISAKIRYTESVIDCIEHTEVCFVVTEWDEFRLLQPEVFVRYMVRPIIIDGRRIFNPHEFYKKTMFYAVGLSENLDDRTDRLKDWLQ